MKLQGRFATLFPPLVWQVMLLKYGTPSVSKPNRSRISWLLLIILFYFSFTSFPSRIGFPRLHKAARLPVVCPHCKEPIPKIRNKYSQKRSCAAPVPISTVMCLWTFCIFPRSICLLCCRKICGPILGIYKSVTDTWMWKLGLRSRNSGQKRNT